MAIFILLGTVMPPMITKGSVEPSKIGEIITYILANALVNQLTFLAFRFPIHLTFMHPDFNLDYLVTNSAGLAFCMMTPVYLAILTLYYPTVDIPTLRVTSLLGILIGFWNLVTNFLMQPDLFWWMGVLYIPLVSISIYALILSFRKTSPGKP